MPCDGSCLPYWARWQARRVEVRPWARVRLTERYGGAAVRLLSIGRGWASVLALVGGEERVHVYRPTDIVWSSAVLLPGCAGVVVELDGRKHRCDVLEVGEARVWRWVARAVEVGATVEGLTG